jgi:hypothetical protein
MINLYELLSGILLAAPAVNTLVGSDPKTAKIWNSWERVNAYPCIVIEVDSDDENNDLSGYSGMTSSKVAVTCRGNSDSDSFALWIAVRAALGSYASNDVDIILDSTSHSATPKGEGSTAHWYDRIGDYTILWKAV